MLVERTVTEQDGNETPAVTHLGRGKQLHDIGSLRPCENQNEGIETDSVNSIEYADCQRLDLSKMGIFLAFLDLRLT